MTDLLRRNPLIAALGVLCAVLVAIVALELANVGASGDAGPVRKPAPMEAKLLPPIAAASPEQTYPETVSRPLWIPTRRPAPAVQVAQASFARGQFILQGVTIAGNTRIAMLKEKSSGRVHRIAKGRDVNGLQVAEIEPDKVTLAQGAEREVIELRVQKPGTPGGPAAPVAAQAAVGGPFAPAGATPGGIPPVAGAPSPSPFGQPIAPPGQVPAGPLSPSQVATPATAANPSARAVPQPPSAAPMTPEELLARRRARRTPSP